jgi:hypothetical protein
MCLSDDTNRIQVFSLDGAFISEWGSTGSTDGQFKVSVEWLAITSVRTLLVTGIIEFKHLIDQLHHND